MQRLHDRKNAVLSTFWSKEGHEQKKFFTSKSCSSQCKLSTSKGTNAHPEKTSKKSFKTTRKKNKASNSRRCWFHDASSVTTKQKQKKML